MGLIPPPIPTDPRYLPAYRRYLEQAEIDQHRKAVAGVPLLIACIVAVAIGIASITLGTCNDSTGPVPAEAQQR